MELSQEQLQAYSDMLLQSESSRDLHSIIIKYTHILNSYGIEQIDDILVILTLTFSLQVKDSLHL